MRREVAGWQPLFFGIANHGTHVKRGNLATLRWLCILIADARNYKKIDYKICKKLILKIFNH